MTDWPRSAREYCLQAEQMLEQGEPVRALAQLTIALEADPGHRMAYRVLRKALERVGAHADVARVAAVLDRFDDAKRFYDLGARAMDQARFRWAASFFRQADALAPGEPGILIEWAVACAHTNRFDQAIEVLRRVDDLDSRFWGSYELAWCLLCLQRADDARPIVACLPDLACEESHVAAVPKVERFLERLDRYGPFEAPTAREWYMLQFGGALLDVAAGPEDRAGGRYGLCEHDVARVAANLGRLVHLAECSGAAPERVVHTNSPASSVMGAALAAHWGVQRETLADAAPGADTLVVASAVEEIYRANLWGAEPGQSLFVYDMRWCLDGYMTPEAAAVLSLRCRFPWADDPYEAGQQLRSQLGPAAEAAAADPGLQAILDAREGLLMGAPDRPAIRPVFSSEMPLPTPTMM